MNMRANLLGATAIRGRQIIRRLGDITAPTISSIDDSGAPDVISFEIDEAALIYWRLALTSGQTTADVLGGGGTVSGSFDVPGGEVNHSLEDDLAVVASGTYYMAFVGEDAEGNATNPPVEIEIMIPTEWELTTDDGAVNFTSVPPASPALSVTSVGDGSVTFA